MVTNSTGCRELNYLLRAFGPIACRHSQLFLQTVKSQLKIELPLSDDRDSAIIEKKILEGNHHQVRLNFRIASETRFCNKENKIEAKN